MKSLLSFALFLTTSGLLPLAASETPSPLMGRWQGKFVNPSKEHGYMENHREVCADVVALGNKRFHIRLFPRFFKRAHIFKEVDATETDGKIQFKDHGWQGEITPEGFTGEAFCDSNNPLKFSMTKVSGNDSATLGMKPPEGATVLFNGENLDAWKMSANGSPAKWSILDDHATLLIPQRNKVTGIPGGSIRTKESFGDIRLHLEFNLAYEPFGTGQGRSNSGVFLQGVYEVQVLDSFGLEGTWNECGALYHTAPPKVNACLPPGEWQTYDILFRAARFNPDGSVAEYPRITVRQNGILIQYNEELHEGTSVIASTAPPIVIPKTGPIELQDHGHPVQYRNIWVTPLSDSAQALIQTEKAIPPNAR